MYRLNTFVFIALLICVPVYIYARRTRKARRRDESLRIAREKASTDLLKAIAEENRRRDGSDVTPDF